MMMRMRTMRSHTEVYEELAVWWPEEELEEEMGDE
jgi:hypothetical protein